MRFFLGYRCSGCGREIPAGSIANECPECARPLLSVYDIDALKKRMTREEFFSYRPGGVWRFSPLLPDFGARVSLGEGNTPLVRAHRLGESLGFDNLYIKDESRNPTGSFKARGMAVAVSRLVGLNIKEAWLPSAGNAALALSAYCARAGIKCNVYLPSSATEKVVEECKLYGARVKVVDGVLGDAAMRMYDEIEGESVGVLTTFREPGRVEGKKTIAFEIESELSADWIIFPTGGGTGIVALWKAYSEMEQIGWLRGARPRLVLVQSEGCAPLVRAFERGETRAEIWKDPHTIASGINVASSRADFLILNAIYESDGYAIAVSDESIVESLKLSAKLEGINFSPEGAATVAGLRKLAEQVEIGPLDRVVIVNTASGIRYNIPSNA